MIPANNNMNRVDKFIRLFAKMSAETPSWTVSPAAHREVRGSESLQNGGVDRQEHVQPGQPAFDLGKRSIRLACGPPDFIGLWVCLMTDYNNPPDLD
jgi:hypothetical protein